MVTVSAVVFFSLFGGYRDDIDRSELRTAGNALSVEIVRILRRAADYGRAEIVTLIREQAEHAGLIVILTDGEGRVIQGFEPARGLKDGRADIGYADIANHADATGWFDTKLHIGGDWRPSLVRVLTPPTSTSRGASGVLMAVTFGDDRSFGSLDELVGRLIVSALAGLAAAVLIAMLLSRQLMRPLEALTGVVRRFGPDRYDMRAAETGPTQVRELASAFNAMADRVSDNERAMRGFIADVSHELRTPLTSIRGFVEALRDGTVTDPERRASSLEVIHVETQRMLRMIEQLLDLSRLEAGQSRLQRSPIDLDELFGYLESMFAARAREQGIDLRLEISPTVPTVDADYDRLVQVLNNLVENALGHTREGSITVSARREDDGLQLSVRDTGEGIAPEDLARLFDRFWQPESRTGPGAGLGLAISREIVRAHGGRIAADSELGVGTTIIVWLPE
ncbi:MAG: ATP-binding protein [Chloroflexota bacterium]|nr:ATP-binding protein [Chloroflexota bacterium]MDE2895828.1 ATP-binding protein [Chloroflexota bacterium]